MAKLMTIKDGTASSVDLPLELVGTPEAPLYKPGKATKPKSTPEVDPPEVDSQAEPADDLEDLDDDALRLRFETVLGRSAGRSKRATMLEALRSAG